jgi:ABC-type uncharacterized transport system fused permease/ATPase subunit
MGRQMRLNWLTQGYAQVAVVFPLLMILPRYLLRQIGWGSLMQVASAFSYVYNSLSFIITRCQDIADAIHRSASLPQRITIRTSGPPVSVENLDLDLLDGTPLLRGITFTAARGEAVLITGPSGTGKGLLRSACWRPTVISVGHRSTLLQFHDDVLDLTRFIPLHERVVLPLPIQFSKPAVITGSL